MFRSLICLLIKDTIFFEKVNKSHKNSEKEKAASTRVISSRIIDTRRHHAALYKIYHIKSQKSIKSAKFPKNRDFFGSLRRETAVRG